MNKFLTYSIVTTSLLLGSGVADVVPMVEVASAQAAENKTEKKRRRTPAMNSRVYSQLARAQQLADEGQVEEGLEVLDDVKDKAKSLNSYEKAMMYNFYGFIYYNAERVDEALASFEQVIEQSPIPESLEKSTGGNSQSLARGCPSGDQTNFLTFG